MLQQKTLKSLQSSQAINASDTAARMSSGEEPLERNPHSTISKPLRIAPVKLVPKTAPYSSFLKESMLRQWIFYSDAKPRANGKVAAGNGFDACLIRIGRRIYINLDSLDAWLLSHQKQQTSPEFALECK